MQQSATGNQDGIDDTWTVFWPAENWNVFSQLLRILVQACCVSPYHRPLQNSAKFCKNIETAQKWANSAARRKIPHSVENCYFGHYLLLMLLFMFMFGWHTAVIDCVCVYFDVQVYSSNLPVIVTDHWYALSAAVFHSSLCNPRCVCETVCDILVT